MLTIRDRSINMHIPLRKPRAPWALLRAVFSKRQFFKRDANPATCSTRTADQHDAKERGVKSGVKSQPSKTHHITHVSSSDFNGTDAIVNQLAALAATVTRSPHSSTTQSTRSSSSSFPRSTSTPVSSFIIQEEDEEESFDYLRSLITVSQQSSELNSTVVAQNEHETQHCSRKRACSRLSLCLGDLPRLSFSSKISRKPCPRYTPLPPAWTPKPVATRPEVRF